jgi:DNA-binding LacI/PurR family transcriptional regulator
LIHKGHRHIAVATLGPRADGVIIPGMERRLEGYRQAVADAGLPPETLQIVYTPGLLSTGHESFQKIWSLRPRPTAVLCVSDVRALGILSGARKEHIHVPDDLAVVGFDGLPEAAVSIPPLTTVEHDAAGRVQRALSMLFGLINEQISESDPSFRHITPVEMIVRESA